MHDEGLVMLRPDPWYWYLKRILHWAGPLPVLLILPALRDRRLLAPAGILLATAVHFALSIAYGLALAALVSRLRVAPSILAGAVFGLFLYGVNMYGFTAVFPWFEAARDWITAATHAVFGVTAAGVYQLLLRRRS